MEFDTLSKPFKRNLTLLQRQLKSAHIKGSITIIRDTIKYRIGKEKEKLHLYEVTYLSDIQRMRDKLPYFLEDLQRLNFTPQVLPEPNKQLYSIRGLDNLLGYQYIIPYALLRLYEEDFSLLLNEASAIRNWKVHEFLNSVNELLGIQLQE
ncbi:20585_t:CDS:2 [Gigaspora margarita]|uniref:20585_t:CDS:1 n=1 Tax=Gigaspora margarita TaxID=4874 RepID=A0ABN7UXM7_GIGMA|nr:20585_t:CDS:2 [Gigaspora margarita]